MRISGWSSDVCSSDLDRTGIGGADHRPQPPLGRSRTEPRRYRDHPQRDRGGQEDGDRGARPSDHRPWGARQPEVDGADLGVGAGAGLSARPVPATAPLAATPTLCAEAPPQLSAKNLPLVASLRPPRAAVYLVRKTPRLTHSQ